MSIKIKVVRPKNFGEGIIKQVIELGRKNKAWPDEDIPYYTENFKKPQNINAVCMNGGITGYILARPHNEAKADLIDDDPDMPTDSSRYYIDVVVADGHRNGKSVLLMLIGAAITEANQRGFFRFSLHCRAINGLSLLIQRLFRKEIKLIRRIDSYPDCNYEPVDYMEVELIYAEWLLSQSLSKANRRQA